MRFSRIASELLPFSKFLSLNSDRLELTFLQVSDVTLGLFSLSDTLKHTVARLL